MLNLLRLLRVSFYPSVALSEAKLLPTEPGVYYLRQFLWIKYIGKAQNLRQRWRSHHHMQRLQQMSWLRLHYRTLPLEQISLVEAVEISRFKPSLNQVQPNIARLRAERRRNDAIVPLLLINGILLVLVLRQHPGFFNELWRMIQSAILSLAGSS